MSAGGSGSGADSEVLVTHRHDLSPYSNICDTGAMSYGLKTGPMGKSGASDCGSHRANCLGESGSGSCVFTGC